MTMIRQWFATLNEILDDIILRYPQSNGDEKSRLQEQWNMLKSLSDDMIEAWLLFEDKMACFRDLQKQQPQAVEPQIWVGPFVKGQGYFKLQMFAQASEQLEQAIAAHPDFIGARLVLAMSRMHTKEWTEAQRHFQLIASVADDAKLKAISYNALGCIQAVYAHLEQAQHYFRKALEADPGFGDSRRNLESCRQGRGSLQLQFGLSELQSLVQA
jgi:tetratricopeptide (TPR) repeat protein